MIKQKISEPSELKKDDLSISRKIFQELSYVHNQLMRLKF